MLNLDQQNKLRDAYRDRAPGWRPATEVYADLARAHVRPHSRVLDLGCGRGGLVEQLGLPPQQLYGVDADWLSLHEHRLPAMARTVATTDELPFAAAQFDLALGSWLFEHLDDPGRTLAQVSRVLRPGGALVFITPNGRHPLAVLNRTLGRMETLQGALVEQFYGRPPTDTFPTRYRANDQHQLDAAAAGAGLYLDQLHYVADPSYLALHPALFGPACRIEEHLPAARLIHLVGVLRKAEEA